MSDYKTILAAVDLSSEADEVAAKATRIAQAQGAQLHLIHVIEPLSFAYGGDIDPFDRTAYRQLQPAEVEAAPVGSILVWDSQYSPRLLWQTPLSLLESSPRFQRLQSYHRDDPLFDLHIFLKVAP